MDRDDEPMSSSEEKAAKVVATTASASSPHHGSKQQPLSPPGGSSHDHNNNSSFSTTPKQKTTPDPPLTVDRARDKLAQQQVLANVLPPDVSESVQLLLKDHDNLKEKVSKLKSLLGRSAKAQREAKVDLEATQKRLDQALREIDRLHKKIDQLSNRPTHMELLADFETNFDRALLSVGQQQKQQQVGGEDTSPAAQHHHPEAAVVENLLMQELTESKQRLEKLESLNAALTSRTTQLQNETASRTRERDALQAQISRLELEKRMAVLQAEQATRDQAATAASLAEMQLEIDLVTKASVNANARAERGQELAEHAQTDRQKVVQLESQVQALQEWALASSQAKTAAQERVRFLEQQLQQRTAAASASAANERVLFTKNGSFVVGAGDVGHRVFSLTPDQAKEVKLSERVCLRWHFELTSCDVDIPFSIMRGACDTAAKRKNADYLVKDRVVTGGAEGEIEDAFTSQQSCTMEWSNAKSWIRPKTIKYNVSAVVLSDEP